MVGLHASCSFFKDMNLQGSCSRAGHWAAKFQTRTEGSLMPTIRLEGVCVIIQIIVLTGVGPLVSRVQLSIPPVFVKVVIKRNREHHRNCFVDVWNVIGQDSDSSRCSWSRRLARSVKCGIPCGKKKKKNKGNRKPISNYWTRLSQNIVICQWREDQLFAKAEGGGK